jgi:hypothetical protein
MPSPDASKNVGGVVDPRTTIASALNEAIRVALAVGDTAAAQLAVEALAKFLGSTAPRAAVIELAKRRAER